MQHLFSFKIWWNIVVIFFSTRFRGSTSKSPGFCLTRNRDECYKTFTESTNKLERFGTSKNYCLSLILLERLKAYSANSADALLAKICLSNLNTLAYLNNCDIGLKKNFSAISKMKQYEIKMSSKFGSLQIIHFWH